MISAPIIRGLRDCFEADRGRQHLWSIYAGDIEHRHVMRDFDDAVISSPSEGYYKSLSRSMEKYRREKKLLYCRGFVVGWRVQKEFGREKKRLVCAPLILHPAYLDNGDIHVGREVLRWNQPLLYWLAGGRDNTDKFYQALEKNAYPHSSSLIAGLRAIGHEVYARCFSTKQIESALKTLCDDLPSNSIVYVEASALLLTRRSLGAQGVIDELTQICEMKDHELTNQIFSGVHSSSLKRVTNHDYYRGSLSEAQRTVLRSARSELLTVVIGPPGTGKSYTISAAVLDHCLRGERVLVVSNNDHAVDVVGDLLTLTHQLDESLIVRVGTKKYLTKMRHHLQRLAGSRDRGENIDAVNQEFLYQNKTLERLWSDWSFLGEFFRKKDFSSVGIFQRIRLYFAGRRIGKKLVEFESVSCLLEEIRQRKNIRDKAFILWKNAFVGNRQKGLSSYQKDCLEKYRKTLLSKSSSSQKKSFQSLDFQEVTKIFPIWLSTLDMLHVVLPLRQDLFDLVVVDESTQCDISSALPAIYRARRSLIVGDTKQLRHMSFLSRKRQDSIMNSQAPGRPYPSFRDDSIIDLALRSVHEPIHLREHYRSLPPLIRFSNHEFYGGAMQVMKQSPLTHQLDVIHLVEIEGRLERGHNAEEVSKILAMIRAIAEDQAASREDSVKSLGVVCMFSEQARHLDQAIENSISQEVGTLLNLKVGTPFHFQGEERDIIILATSVDSKTQSQSYAYINREDVFNVAITRASQMMFVILSAPVSALPDSLLSKYIQHLLDGADDLNSIKTSKNTSAISDELLSQMHRNSIEVFFEYPLAGVSVGILLVKNSRVLAIDIIGHPQVDALTRVQIESLERAGFEMLTFGMEEWDSGKCVKQINEYFSKSASSHSLALMVKGIQLWAKLKPYDEALASKVRAFEHQLINKRYTSLYTVLKRLTVQYVAFRVILSERLNPGELTYLRQVSYADSLLLACLEEIHNHVESDRIKSLSAVSGDLKLENFESLEDASDILTQLTEKWRQTKTKHTYSDVSVQDAVANLRRQISRIEHYDTDSEA